MNNNNNNKYPTVSVASIENDSQYRKILKRLRSITESLKSTEVYLSDKLYPLTGSIQQVTDNCNIPQEVFVPLVSELNDIYNELTSVNDTINFILNRVEL